MKNTTKTILAISLGLAFSTQAFELKSLDIKEGHPMDKAFEFNDWGCSGDNISPQLSWTNPPEGTQSYAITAFDPDAPTGSGFWHWVAYDISSTVKSLPQDADISKVNGTELRIDYGLVGFGGACPPEDHGMHRYQFTVWALPTKTLDIQQDTPPAVVGFILNNTALDKATLTATYAR